MGEPERLPAEMVSASFFTVLGGASGANNAASVTSQIDQTRLQAEQQLSRARGLSVPDAARAAHANVVLALQMRRDGIADVARQLQPALSNWSSLFGEFRYEDIDAGDPLIRFDPRDVRRNAHLDRIDRQYRLGGRVDLAPANSVWVQAGVAWRREVLDVLAREFGAGFRTVDYEKQPEPARQAINAWVAERTRKRIAEPHGEARRL